jgi:hypothetical protein
MRIFLNYSILFVLSFIISTNLLAQQDASFDEWSFYENGEKVDTIEIGKTYQLRGIIRNTQSDISFIDSVEFFKFNSDEANDWKPSVFNVINDGAPYKFNILPNGFQEIIINITITEVGFVKQKKNIVIIWPSESFVDADTTNNYGKFIVFVKEKTSSIYENNELNKLNLYPNPITNGVVSFESPVKLNNAKLEIFSLNGKVVFSKNLISNAGDLILINMPTDLESGQYLIKVSSKETYLYSKILYLK